MAMKIFVLKRTKDIGWCEDFEMTVIAPDKRSAKKMARKHSHDFEQCDINDIEAIEIDINEAKVLTIANTGA